MKKTTLFAATTIALSLSVGVANAADAELEKQPEISSSDVVEAQGVSEVAVLSTEEHTVKPLEETTPKAFRRNGTAQAKAEAAIADKANYKHHAPRFELVLPEGFEKKYQSYGRFEVRTKGFELNTDIFFLITLMFLCSLFFASVRLSFSAFRSRKQKAANVGKKDDSAKAKQSKNEDKEPDTF